MHLLDIPIPAFECIIEHMVTAIGLYKAVRLRMVCKEFDAEVMRVIFGTRILDHYEGYRIDGMGAEWVKRRLEARILKPHVFGRDPLTSTIRQVAEALLDDGDVQKVEEQRPEYTRALCAATAYGTRTWKPSKAEILKSNDKAEGSLLDQSANILAGAAAVGNIHKLQTLLSRGADPNVESHNFGFALEHAARLGLRDIMLLLIEYNAKTRSYASSAEAGAAALKAACKAGQGQIVECVLNSEYETHISHKAYEDAVVTAAGNGHVDVMWSILDRGRFFKKESVMAQALFASSMEGYLHVVQALLDSGLDVDTRRVDGQTSLHMAAREGHARVVRLLLDRGAWYHEGRYGDPLYLAALNGHENVVQMLLDGGADINARGGNDCDVFVRAATNGEIGMVQFFLEKGFDLQAFPYTDHVSRGDLALEGAAERGHEDMVRLLVGLGVDVNGGELVDGPMLRAMMSNSDHIVKTLLELGAKEVDPLKTDCGPYFDEDGKGPSNWRQW